MTLFGIAIAPPSAPALCSDFVIEIKSGSDRQVALRMKMREYLENGAQLGLLILNDDQR